MTASNINLSSFHTFCCNIKASTFYFIFIFCFIHSNSSEDFRCTCLNQAQALPSSTPTYKLDTFENSPPSENHCLVSPRQQTAKRLMSSLFIYVLFQVSFESKIIITQQPYMEMSGSGCSGRKGFDHSSVFVVFRNY